MPEAAPPGVTRGHLNRRTLSIALATLLFAGASLAHDFWIEPSTFHPAHGETVSIGLRVGQDYLGDPVPRMSTLIEHFTVRQKGREAEIDGIERADPAGFFTADGGATAIVAYTSNPSHVDLPAAKFEDYLRLYGLEQIIALRARRGERQKAGSENFVRCAKALLTGARPSLAATQAAGLPYEIVPASDPTAAPAAGHAPFRGRVLYRRTPLAGALVVAIFRDDTSLRLTARSAADGTFTFALPKGGVWLVKSVHMVDAPSGSGAEWESFWASLTFDWPAQK
jgi:uncharacterized GH25 family protein